MVSDVVQKHTGKILSTFLMMSMHYMTSGYLVLLQITQNNVPLLTRGEHIGMSSVVDVMTEYCTEISQHCFTKDLRTTIRTICLRPLTVQLRTWRQTSPPGPFPLLPSSMPIRR